MLRLAKKDEEQELISQILSLLKEHPKIKWLFDKYNVDIEKIHDIPISFDKIDVSAKSKKGNITLNKNMIEDGNFIEDLHYIVHELVHVLQQYSGKVNDFGDLKQFNYLDNPLEIEAFKEQIDFISQYKSPEEAEEYLRKLLDFHGYEGEERKKKIQQLKG